MRRRALLLSAGAMATAGAATAHEPTARAVGLRPAGEGLLRVWGLEVYLARLWVGEDFRAARYDASPLLLELAYRRAFGAEAIARRSLHEMRRLEPIDEARARRWQQALQALLPDVEAGDRLSGLHRPARGALFLDAGGRPLGEIAEPAFSRLFFGIWLAEQGSAPELRRQLLGPLAAS